MLSRFAVLRRVGRQMVLESPRSTTRLELSARAIHRLAPFMTAPGALIRGPFPRLLHQAGVLTPASGSGRTAEDRDLVLRQWEPVDLLFHTRTRLGRHDYPVGATWEFLGKTQPAPATLRRSRRGAIPLPRALRRRRSSDALTRILSRRRSLRTGRALTLEELGAFLFRSARVSSLTPAGPRLPYATTRRPYPSGGACYPLEVYLAVQQCEGLKRGFYHYDPVAHRLAPLPQGKSQVDGFFADLRQPIGATPPVLFVITARFARVSWKYRAMAYSTILKDVGALFQTMYLVAMDLGLSPCAIGCGDVERSARALGSRFEAESSVGEFLLGGPPRGSRAR